MEKLMTYLKIGVFLFCASLFATEANAVELEDCNKLNGIFNFEQRMTCLQKNIVLLNSAFEKVSAELRETAAELRGSVKDLKEAGFFAPGDRVQLQSGRFPAEPGTTGQCADQKSPMFPDGDADFLLAAPCTGDKDQRWTMQR
jgi:hypothetical protein